MTIKYANNYVDTTNFSDVTPTIALVANSVLSFTVPGNYGNKLQVIFSYNASANVYVGYNQSPSVPTAGSINASGRFEEYRPLKRFVNGGDVLYFVTPDTEVYMGISFREIAQAI